MIHSAYLNPEVYSDIPRLLQPSARYESFLFLAPFISIKAVRAVKKCDLLRMSLKITLTSNVNNPPIHSFLNTRYSQSTTGKRVNSNQKSLMKSSAADFSLVFLLFGGSVRSLTYSAAINI